MPNQASTTDSTEEMMEEIALPDLDIPDFIEVKKLEDIETKTQKCSIEVKGFHVVNPGWLSSDYALFHVETVESDSGKRVKVNRRDNDFYSLRKVLRMQFPCLVVPPLPKVNLKLTDKMLLKR